jgi:hypothetical protein
LFAALLFTRANSRAGEDAASNREVPREGIEWVLSKVECDNPEYLCRKMGFDNPELYVREGRAFHYKGTDFEVQPLGDGTDCYVFEPPGGICAVRHYFVKQRGKMRLLYEGSWCWFLGHKPKVNGRYVMWEFDRYRDWSSDRRRVTTETQTDTIFFWNGSEYVEAYTKAETYTDEELCSSDPVPMRTEVKWNQEAKDEFLKAPRTWAYTVEYGDTLAKIARQFETDMDEIVRQNGIENPDRIFEGQALTYDSRKARKPVHRPRGGVLIIE